MGHPSENSVSIRGLEKEYGKFHLGPIDLELAKGCVYGLIGRNGAGKTTLLKSLMNMAKPSRGTVEVLGLAYPGSEKEIKEHIGYVPEEPYLYKNVNSKWLGSFVSRYYDKWSWETYRKLLEEFGVDPAKPTKALSRGTKVKLELALVLSRFPDLLILDEPTSGLDPIVRGEILRHLAAVVQDEGKTVLFSTHITDDAERVADYIIFMVDGKAALVDDAVSLKENWQEMLLDGSESDQIPGLVSLDAAGEGVVKIVTSEGPSCLSALRARGLKPIARRALGLDEILEILTKDR